MPRPLCTAPWPVYLKASTHFVALPRHTPGLVSQVGGGRGGAAARISPLPNDLIDGCDNILPNTDRGTPPKWTKVAEFPFFLFHRFPITIAKFSGETRSRNKTSNQTRCTRRIYSAYNRSYTVCPAQSNIPPSLLPHSSFPVPTQLISVHACVVPSFPVPFFLSRTIYFCPQWRQKRQTSTTS